MRSVYIKSCFVTLLIANAYCAYDGNIFSAAKTGDMEAITRIVRENPEAVNAWQQRKTALHWAVQFRHRAAIELLLRLGADVNGQATDYDEAPLHEALRGKDCYNDVVLLVQHGADVNESFIEYTSFLPMLITPLHEALAYRNFKGAKFLIRHGASVSSDEEKREIRNLQPHYDWRADKAQFIKARIACLMNQLGVPEVVARLILEIEGVVSSLKSEADDNGSKCIA